ncbi:MAG: AzlD domain-containing protein, partial [Gammaproteobacteria bacterium]
ESAILWALVLACTAATFVWRALGVAFAARIDTDGAVFQWVTCVSYAMVAALVSRITLLPAGALAETPLLTRLLAMGVGFAVYFLCGRSLLPAIISGALVLIALSSFPVLDEALSILP